MASRSRFRPKELVLVSLPVLVLVVVGVARRDRGPFKLVVAKATIGTPPPGREIVSVPKLQHTRPVQVRVFLDHTGNTPEWWGQLRSPNTEVRVNFSAKGEKDDGSNVGGYDVCQYDQASGLYSFTYCGNIPDAPSYIAGANCFIGVRLYTQDPQRQKLGETFVSIPARRMGKSTKFMHF